MGIPCCSHPVGSDHHSGGKGELQIPSLCTGVSCPQGSGGCGWDMGQAGQAAGMLWGPQRLQAAERSLCQGVFGCPEQPWGFTTILDLLSWFPPDLG